MISRRFVVAAFALGLSAFVAPQISFAGENHVAEAIEHTKEAITIGRAGQSDKFVDHSEEALKHAQAAEAEKANPHTEEAIKHLQEGIKVGSKGHVDDGVKHAKEALTHLEEAQK